MILLKGNAVSRGIAAGKVFIYKAFSCDVDEAYFKDGAEQEYYEKFEAALDSAQKELDGIIAYLGEENAEKAKIFDAHKSILYDGDLLERIKYEMFANKFVPEYAVNTIYGEYIKLLSRVKDPLIAERVDDVRDVRNRVLRILKGEKEYNLSAFNEDVIVVAHDLLPSDTAMLDRKRVKGIITEVGGLTSHTAIIAKACGIPAILGVASATEILTDGTQVILDAANDDSTGIIRINPDEHIRSGYEQKKKRFLKEEKKIQGFIGREARLKSGERISIGINIDGSRYGEAVKNCDFVGVFRTELLFINDEEFPPEERQFQSYKEAVEKAGGKAVTIRTIDTGYDKTMRFTSNDYTANSLLGCRGIRYCLKNTDIFKIQLRAIYRASAFGKVKILFPMVSCVEDFIKAKALCEEVKGELREEKTAFDENTKLGVMIEVPQAAFSAYDLAKLCDFASVGTNDLCQYFSAADRNGAIVSEWYQSYSPALLRLLKFVIEEFKRADKPISVCGEFASERYGIILLAGMGYDKFSVNESGLARTKKVLSETTLEEAVKLTETVTAFSSEDEVKRFLFMNE